MRFQCIDWKPQVTGVLDHPGRSPRGVRRGIATVCSEHRAGAWEVSRSYGLGELSAESRYGAPELGVQGALRGALREGLGARVRVRLGYPWKGVPSCLYRAVPDGSNEGRGNLTGRLTACLTTSLTAHLTRSLTKSGVPSGREGGQTGLRDRLEAVSAFPLGGVEHFCHDAVVDSQSLLDDSFP